jgi:hypothetical protein
MSMEKGNTLPDSAAKINEARRDALQRFDETKSIWASLKPKQKEEITALSKNINKAERQVRAIMAGPVSRLCPTCKKSCCDYTSYCYLNMTDNIQYIALGRQAELEGAIVLTAYCSSGEQSAEQTAIHCLMFEEKRGCRLPGDHRPWTCVRFICDGMKSELGDKEATIKNLFRSISLDRRRIQSIMKNRQSRLL